MMVSFGCCSDIMQNCLGRASQCRLLQIRLAYEHAHKGVFQFGELSQEDPTISVRGTISWTSHGLNDKKKWPAGTDSFVSLCS